MKKITLIIVFSIFLQFTPYFYQIVFFYKEAKNTFELNEILSIERMLNEDEWNNFELLKNYISDDFFKSNNNSNEIVRDNINFKKINLFLRYYLLSKKYESDIYYRLQEKILKKDFFQNFELIDLTKLNEKLPLEMVNSIHKIGIEHILCIIEFIPIKVCQKIKQDKFIFVLEK